MRSLLSLAASAVFLASISRIGVAANANSEPATSVNATHFVDPATNNTYKHFDCDVTQHHASDHFLDTVKGLHNRHKSSNVGSRAARDAMAMRQAQPISITTHIHIITKTASAGTITQAMANAQITAMNKVYNQYGITFVLASTDFTANDAWAVAAGADMAALKAALRKGTYSELNLYFHTDLNGGMLGTCTLPNTLPSGATATTYVSDGCNVQAGTMPGGSVYGFNQGMTAVHETGHWLGLLHTFEGNSCTGDGDFIADTRAESVSTDGCPSSPAKNSCPSLAGVDPINNYMDYSTDACYSQFTPLQITRIQTLWTQYRKGH